MLYFVLVLRILNLTLGEFPNVNQLGASICFAQ
jgi:hypothetical protein